jgi:hypothetical protein
MALWAQPARAPGVNPTALELWLENGGRISEYVEDRRDEPPLWEFQPDWLRPGWLSPEWRKELEDYTRRRREEEARTAGFDMSWLTLEAIGVGVCERSLSAWDLSVLRREGGIIER